ncbi:MAG: AAA family ATPase [Raoultibacter sp.]
MFERHLVAELAERLQEERDFIQILVGPRQTGKSTAISQMLEHIDMPYHLVAADDPSLGSSEWLASEWRRARALTEDGTRDALFIVDEIQKVPHWAAMVKKMWDEDTRSKMCLKVLLTGSSSLLLQKGMEDSLMGRFEVIYSLHWNYFECAQAFGYSLDDFLFYGGYPGAAKRKDDTARWARYLQTSIVNPTIAQDVLEMERVEKPALLKALFTIGSAYSAQEISYTKMMGQLQDAGNTTTIAHYLDLLDKAGMLRGLQKYAQDTARIRRSSPRLMVHDTSLMTYSQGASRDLLLSDPEKRGHLVESAVGAYLIARSTQDDFDLFWWRTKRGDEVDFLLRKSSLLTAIEVKSGRIKGTSGLQEFLKLNPSASSLVIGSAHCSLEDFLSGNIPLFVV